MRAVKSTLTVSEAPLPLLGPYQILVKVKCFGVTQDDVSLHKQGITITKLGTEFSGVVVETSKESDANTIRFKVGDSVFGYKGEGGSMAQFVACDASMLVHIPQCLSFEMAATIPDMWISALQFLKYDGEFAKRNRIAVFDALSSRGQAIVQLAQIMGCRRVHCIVSNEAATKKVEKYLKLHTALIDEVVSHHNNIQQNITLYDPKGLEVVVDLRLRPEIRPEAMRPYGRIVITHSPEPSQTVDWKLLTLKCVKIHSAKIRSQNPKNFVKCIEFIVDHLLPKIAKKQIYHNIAKKYDWNHVRYALEYVEANSELIGRVVCIINE